MRDFETDKNKSLPQILTHVCQRGVFHLPINKNQLIFRMKNAKKGSHLNWDSPSSEESYFISNIRSNSVFNFKIT